MATVNLSRRLRGSAGLSAVLLLSALAVGYAGGAHWGADKKAWDPHEPGPVDVGFSQDMAVHHDQAVLMAGLATQRGGITIKAIAESILRSQSQQIGTLRGWLQLWGKPATAQTAMQWAARDRVALQTQQSRVQGHEVMAGMASPQEMLALWGKRGDEFDVLFMQLMIRHHLGGIDMARYAAEHGQVASVQQIARVMMVQQVEEVAQMQRLLAVHGARELPYPAGAMCLGESVASK